MFQTNQKKTINLQNSEYSFERRLGANLACPTINSQMLFICDRRSN
jgi:hypothetical protein